MQGGFARAGTAKKPKVRVIVKNTKSTATVSTRLTLDERAQLETVSANTFRVEPEKRIVIVRSRT
jgi:hypothetical protein